MTDTIERELTISARPETVFGFLTDPEKVARWMGRSVTGDGRVGGALRVDYNGFDIMRGRFIELVPFSRVVLAWGWESLDPEAIQPGASRVEFTLASEGSATKLRMVHSGLTAMATASHSEGWDVFLPRLGEAAAGGEPATLSAPLSEAEEAGARLNALLIRLIDAVEACPASRWAAVIAHEGQTTGALAHHIVQHTGLVAFVHAIGDGIRGPQADFTAEALDGFNAAHAREFAGVTREDVLRDARSLGSQAVSTLRAMTSAQLAQSQSMTFADGAELRGIDIVQGPLLSHIDQHLSAFMATAEGQATGLVQGE